MYAQPQQFAQSPYMAPQSPYMPPQPQYMAPQSPYMSQQSGTPTWVIAVGVVAIIALAAYVLKVGPFAPAVVPGALGGVAPSTTPTGKAPVPTVPTPVQVATSPPVAAPQVSTITLTKDTSATPNLGDGHTFALGELKVFDSSNRVLAASDFSGATVNAAANTGWANSFPISNATDGQPGTFANTGGYGPIHQMIFTLRNPTNVKRIQVLNRADCCQDRLAGVVCELKSSSGVLIKRFTLTDEMVQDLVVS